MRARRSPSPLDVGFVRVEGSRDGVGKLLSVQDGKATIEYFVSPAGPQLRRIEVAQARVRAVQLSEQTRVYYFDSECWRVGRAELPHKNGYHVSFPNRVRGFVPQDSLFTRCAHPIDDPTDYLAARITETPFFYDRRSAIVRYLAAQRAAFGGLTGLASSAIELMEHQVSIVRRILTDPIQRYLLADEVGLGKTIEAGILMRQHVIDHPTTARILVVTPPHLLEQWRAELITKFFLDTHVALVSEEDICRTALDQPLTMLVIDEAHRVARSAFLATPKERLLYETLRQLARRTPRLLLLSGTPVLHQEDDFLAMLHLLDPDGYPLEDRDVFRRRVRDRQTIAEVIADLGDDAGALFVLDAVSQLERLFSDDPRLMQLCREARTYSDAAVDSPERHSILRALRIHVTETYRLHRRLLRTRRDDARLQLHLPERTGVVDNEHQDQARAEAFDFIEAWRSRCPIQQSGDYADIHKGLCAVFVQAALSHPRVLLRYIDARLAIRDGRTVVGLSDACHRFLQTPWAFEEEEALLRERRELIAAHVNSDARTERLITWLRLTPNARKVIVFVDDAVIADDVHKQLADKFGALAVLRHTLGKGAERTFVDDPRVRLLICDANAEEGLNLQYAAATLVHYDLPLEATRIEQRIGRIDRIAARGRMRNVLFTSNERYEREWRGFLVDAIRIFNRSVAPLQYILVAAMTRIRTSLIVDGADAIASEARRMVDAETGCDAELRRIQQQEALDAFEFDPTIEEAFFERLTEADTEIEEQGRQAFDAWVVDCLQFKRASYGPSMFRYVHDMDRPTLVPVIDAVSRFEKCIDVHAPRPHARALLFRLGTFERDVAERKQIDLLRVGHPFVDGMETLVRADDRGTAFAIWRFIPTWSDDERLFFRFDFVVDADLSEAETRLKTVLAAPEALRRRAREAFPVTYQTIWVDSDLIGIDDPALLRLLELPYQKTRPDGSRDTNIRLGRWRAVDGIAPVGEWSELCERTRQAAERILRSTDSFTDLCRTSARKVRDTAAANNDQFRSRIARLRGAAKDAEVITADLELEVAEALANGMESPLLRVDSAGAIYISRTPLNSET